jgi:hypothetical protein
MARTAVGFVCALALLLATLPQLGSAHRGHENNNIDLLFEDALPVAHVPSTMRLVFLNRTTGTPLPLDIAHERTFHAFMVSDDLGAFAHIHPEDFPEGMADSEQGAYRLEYLFPGGGTYHMVVDYTTHGMNEYQMLNITVDGQPRAVAARNFDKERSFDGYTVRLEAPERIVAGEETAFAYHISKDGADVTDLQMYLGAEMHVFLAQENFTDVGHTHAYRPGHSVHIGTMPQRYIGPAVPIRYTFRQSGTYVLYGQFKRDGTITTTQFYVDVAAPYAVPWRALLIVSCVLVALLCAYGLMRTPRGAGKG